MQTELNHTVKSLFDRENLDELPREDLHLMTVKYPYSSILQFLYTRKLQSQKDLGYAGSVAKTALYFSNPHWLHHQLRVKSKVENLAEMEKVYQESHIQPVETIQETVQSVIEQPEDLIKEESNVSVYGEEESGLLSTGTVEAEQLNIGETVDDANLDQTAAELIHPENIPEVSSNPLLEIVQEIVIENVTADIPEPELLKAEALPENLVNEETSENEDSSEINVEMIISPESRLLEINPADEQQAIEDSEVPPAIITEIQVVSETAPASGSAETMEIPFEPLYAVDYFASQGIRLREEDQQDQLGKKLKSFTEWLKSMKKIHPEKSRDLFDAKTEASIKSEADQSNDKADVLTETMAEVLIKQGLIQKAIEVYEKLSLLDPAKSATFAAKISELKAN